MSRLREYLFQVAKRCVWILDLFYFCSINGKTEGTLNVLMNIILIAGRIHVLVAKLLEHYPGHSSPR